ncbi:radical SAM protein [Candidatus Bathyarchaeota archaeon]|nr:radical SAM protein [Candidatus Bathyarchaeota archaeon]
MWKLLRPDAKTVLLDKKVRLSLARYFGVMENDKLAKFLIAKKLEANFNKADSLDKLWMLHKKLTEKFYIFQNEIDNQQKLIKDLDTPECSFLDLKIEIAQRILKKCHFCIRRCEINRHKGESGYCRCGTKTLISTIFPHTGEEPELVPSGTIFTLGCTLRCIYCQNWEISQWFDPGEAYSPRQLADAVEALRREGCRNVNLVGGDPTSWLTQWLETFKQVNVNVPIVWNSNSYYSIETARLLAGFVDVYLLDFKYGQKNCAEKLSDAPNYWDTCTQNHLYAKKYGELIIRILVLPKHLECCTKPILRWITENLGTSVRVNLMFQYHPKWRSQEKPELNRSLTETERKRAIQLVNDSELTNFLT